MCKKATNDNRIYPHFPTPEKLTNQDKPTKALITSSATSLHSQLADQIREMIYSRELISGEKILSEHELMNRFGISRGTVRHAIETLVNEGLLLRVHGKGTYVAEEGLSHPAGVRPLSFAESLKNQGMEFETKVLEKKVLPAPENVKNELQASTSDLICFLRRVRYVGGEPILCQESWTNLSECPGYEKADFQVEPAFSAAERCSGKKIAYSKIRYTARAAGVEHGRYLHCDENSPILVLEQTIRFADKTPFEWSLTWLTSGQAVVGDAIQPRNARAHR